jgi:predicted DCC family thiol-disulfide oxidoreductase YuxK
MDTTNKTIFLFDGVCGFCSASVDFILKHDKKDAFRFAALQTEVGKKLIREYGLDPEKTDTAVVITGGRAYLRSDAGLMICKMLGGGWALLHAFWIVPRFIRDIVYRIIARNRYTWFGKKESCRMPTASEREKFLL